MLYDRLKRVLTLYNRLETGQATDLRSLCNLLGISRRTMNRDLALLRGAGFPVHLEQRKGSYRLGKKPGKRAARGVKAEPPLLSMLQQIAAGVADVREKLAASSSAADIDGGAKKVFIVHGHNEGVRESVARFLEKLNLAPIVLHEQPNRGRTIIEKFFDYAEVTFAVVLLTADDYGGTQELKKRKPRPRARQNVILELGFFLGKLGRERVCALYEEGVEIPSDYQGVLFVPLDSQQAWQMRLAIEMKEAGLDIGPILGEGV